MFVRNKRPGSSARFFKAPTNKKLRGTWIGSPSNRDGNDICARIQKLFDVIDLCYSRLQIGFNAEYVPIDNDFEEKSAFESKLPEQTREALSTGQRRSPVGTADARDWRRCETRSNQARLRKATPGPVTTAARVAANLEVVARKDSSH